MKTIHLAGVTAAAGLAVACGNVSSQATNWRTVAAGDGVILTVRAEGGPQHRLVADGSDRAQTGETVHRILRGDDGGVLFAYDVVLRRTGDKKQFRLQLLPSAGTVPTFASKREVMAKTDEDLVRVELMEQPETHEKIVDVYRLASPAVAERESGEWSLMKAHNALFRWVHGL
jgi:hypothetical protein